MSQHWNGTPPSLQPTPAAGFVPRNRDGSSLTQPSSSSPDYAIDRDLVLWTCDGLLLRTQVLQFGSPSHFTTGVKIVEDCRLPLATEPSGLRVREQTLRASLAQGCTKNGHVGVLGGMVAVVVMGAVKTTACLFWVAVPWASWPSAQARLLRWPFFFMDWIGLRTRFRIMSLR